MNENSTSGIQSGDREPGNDFMQNLESVKLTRRRYVGTNSHIHVKFYE